MVEVVFKTKRNMRKVLTIRAAMRESVHSVVTEFHITTSSLLLGDGAHLNSGSECDR